MDFHQLRVFIEAAREKSFSRAAEKIFLTQPTVSAHIKSLENELGTPLFERSQKEIKLTAAGRVLYGYARELLDIKDKAFSVILKETNKIEGHLEIAASSVPGSYLLPGLLFSFKEKYPAVYFSLLLRDTGQVIESVKNFTYNIGFTGEPAAKSELETIRISKDDMILVTSPHIELPTDDSPDRDSLPEVSLKNCLNLPFIMREPGSATRLAFEKALKHSAANSKKIKIAAYLESQEAIKEAVRTGLGVSVITRMAVEKDLAAGHLKGYRFKDLKLEREFYLVTRKKIIHHPLTKTFIAHTLNYFNIKNEV